MHFFSLQWSSRSRSSVGVLALLVHWCDAACSDDAIWKDPTYGMGCDFYAKNDLGCTKFIDLGQISNCNQTCGNCEGSRLPPYDADPLDTTCSVAELCTCFEGCSPASLCPASDAAQVCRVETTVADSTTINQFKDASKGKPWLELTFSSPEQVVGVDISGGKSQYAKTITATWSDKTGTGASFANVDAGQPLPANWAGGYSSRVLFKQGPVKARVLRLYPNVTAGSASSVLSELLATAVVRRCADSVGPTTAAGKCSDLKCRAYCYKALECQGSWVNYCEAQKEQNEACDVQCSHAPRQTGALHWHMGVVAVLLFAVFH